MKQHPTLCSLLMYKQQTDIDTHTSGRQDAARFIYIASRRLAGEVPPPSKLELDLSLRGLSCFLSENDLAPCFRNLVSEVSSKAAVQGIYVDLLSCPVLPADLLKVLKSDWAKNKFDWIRPSCVIGLSSMSQPLVSRTQK